MGLTDEQKIEYSHKFGEAFISSVNYISALKREIGKQVKLSKDENTTLVDYKNFVEINWLEYSRLKATEIPKALVGFSNKNKYRTGNRWEKKIRGWVKESWNHLIGECYNLLSSDLKKKVRNSGVRVTNLKNNKDLINELIKEIAKKSHFTPDFKIIDILAVNSELNKFLEVLEKTYITLDENSQLSKLSEYKNLPTLAIRAEEIEIDEEAFKLVKVILDSKKATKKKSKEIISLFIDNLKRVLVRYHKNGHELAIDKRFINRVLGDYKDTIFDSAERDIFDICVKKAVYSYSENCSPDRIRTVMEMLYEGLQNEIFSKAKEEFEYDYYIDEPSESNKALHYKVLCENHTFEGLKSTHELLAAMRVSERAMVRLYKGDINNLFLHRFLGRSDLNEVNKQFSKNEAFKFHLDQLDLIRDYKFNYNFQNNLSVSITYTLTANGVVSHKVEGLGSYNRKKDVLQNNGKKSVLQKIEIIKDALEAKANDSDIAKHLKDFPDFNEELFKNSKLTQSKIHEYNQFFSKLFTCLFLVEGVRNPAAFILHPVILERVISDHTFTFEKAFSEYFLMAPNGATSAGAYRHAEILRFAKRVLPVQKNKGHIDEQVVREKRCVKEQTMDHLLSTAVTFFAGKSSQVAEENRPVKKYTP